MTALVLASLLSGLAVAATLEVPGDFPTIKAALAEAQNGDTIEVAPGRYVEYGLVMQPGIYLMGMGADPGATIIDAQEQGRILTASFLDDGSFISNLTFANGWANEAEGYGEYGGAIYINHSRLWIQDCHFLNNGAGASGGAICCMTTTSLIYTCYFEGNWAAKGGGALDCTFDASPSLGHCSFVDNTAAYGGALSCRSGSSPELYKVHFDRNSSSGDFDLGGAVIAFLDSSPVFKECTFSRNTAAVGGALFADQGSPVDLNLSTIVHNSASNLGAGLFSNDAELSIHNSIIAFQNGVGLETAGRAVPVLECTNIYGNSSGDWIGSIASQATLAGNLSVDPLFCETDLDDVYHFMLEEGSPCSEEGGACRDLGAWPVGCDTPLAAEIPSLQNFEAAWENGSPTVVWTLDPGFSPGDFRLVRFSSLQPDAEEEIPIILGHDGALMALDVDLAYESGQEYGYRLYYLMPSGGEVLLGELELEMPTPVLTISAVEAWPNPFNPQTTIHFELGSPQKITVDIYDIAGRLVRSLVQDDFPMGPQSVIWNGRDNSGRFAASGPYMVVISGQGDSQRLKVTLLK